MLGSASAFRPVAAGMVHQDATHELGRNGKEMGAALPMHTLAAGKFHICLIDERCGLQAVAGPLVRHIVAREAAQLSVNHGDKLVQGMLVALAPSLQQGADLIVRRRGHADFLPMQGLDIGCRPL